MYEYPHPPRASESDLRQYRVQLGLNRVTVASRNEHEAILAARRLLCRELPRMWDVIAQLEPHRFAVECLE